MLLVTGITGKTGRYFLQELIDNKYEGRIRCIIRDTSNTNELDNCGLNIEKLVGDLSDREFMDKALVGIDTVIHIASIFYSASVVESAIKNNVRRAILVHTTGIYSKYKIASEEYKNIEFDIDKLIKEKNSNIGIIYLRPTMIYGYMNDNNMIIFIKMVDKLRIIPFINHKDSFLQPVNGKDLGKAYYQILNHKEIIQGDYILSGDRPILMKDMFKLISDILNKKTILIGIPSSLGVLVAKCLKLITFSKIDFVEKVLRMGEDRSFNHEEAKRDFGYEPMEFLEGLTIEIQEYLKR